MYSRCLKPLRAKLPKSRNESGRWTDQTGARYASTVGRGVNPKERRAPGQSAPALRKLWLWQQARAPATADAAATFVNRVEEKPRQHSRLPGLGVSGTGDGVPFDPPDAQCTCLC